jgi:hypothetical protein
VLKVPKVQQVR